ncbi:MAG TPA: serine/threonine-protein kinase [Kofleriaceae bacterium]|nr:serine/threonine-protein kinase [Kofleriaceae bacterium]
MPKRQADDGGSTTVGTIRDGLAAPHVDVHDVHDVHDVPHGKALEEGSTAALRPLLGRGSPGGGIATDFLDTHDANDARNDARNAHDAHNAFASRDLHDAPLHDAPLHGAAGRAAGTSASFREHQIGNEVGPEGKYVLQHEIGRGGMGRVYRAQDRYLLRDVAIKFILRPPGMEHEDFMALFWQEAFVIARLDQHDNIVRILDVDRSTYPPFIVMEYLDGQSLDSLMRRGPLDLRTALHVIIGATRGLREAHTKGVFHSDLKPSNIFIQKTGRVKLLDFGLARLHRPLAETSVSGSGDLGSGSGSGAAAASASGPQTTPRNTAAGTPAYMAPEQWRGEDATAASDLWAIGVILYRLLAGTPPFAAPTLTALADRVLSGHPPPSLATLCPEAPGALRELVERLLRFDPDARPQDAAEVIAVLESVLPESTDRLHPVPPPPQRLPYRAAEFWSHTGVPGCLTHESGSDTVLRYWPKALLVLVPDRGTDLEGAWKDLPAWILNAAGVDIDVLYGRAMTGAPEEHAASLRAILDRHFQRPRHIFFVTQGAGAAAVLRLLRDEARRLGERSPGKFELDVRSPWYRTRSVAIVAPRGATPAPDVAGLAAELTAEAHRFIEANLPTPALHHLDIEPSGDAASAPELAALRAGSPLVKSLALLLVRPEAMVARETLAQSFELDCAAKVVSLIAPAEDGHDRTSGATVLDAQGGTQAEIFAELLALTREQHQRPVNVVVTGDAGVGKSTLLRMIARRLCGEHLTALHGQTAAPFFIPLYFVKLPSDRLKSLALRDSEGAQGRLLHDMLLDWWCEWVSSITYEGLLSFRWVTARLRSEPAVLILDGVDEFLTNHPGLGIAHVRQMITFLGTEYRQNGWLTILLGVRSTQPGLGALASSSRNIYELLRLTTAQAVRQFPAASTWLDATVDVQLEKLLFTPLILAQLTTQRPLRAYKPSTRSEIILLALTTIIEQSELCGKLDEQNEPIEAPQWIDALMIVAWFLFRRLRGEIAVSALRLEAADLYRAWAEHFERAGQPSQGESLLSGIRLLCDGRACDMLVRRTILYPTGRGEVRFIHREWQDFLASRYLAQVIAHRHVDELRHVGYTPRMCRAAGELLCQAGVSIDEALVSALLRRTRETGARLIVANFSALLTSSRVPIEGPAIDVLLSAIRAMPAIARCIALNGLGYRALRDDDSCAQDLRHRISRTFHECLAASAADDDIGVMRSIAWCYLKAYAQKFGSPPPDGAWPGLGENAERAVLSMMCQADETGVRILDEHRSVQLAFLEVQHIVLEDPCRPISVAHYLYCLVVARRHGGGVVELGRELPAILAPASPHARVIEGYQLVPELREVFAACRRLNPP